MRGDLCFMVKYVYVDVLFAVNLLVNYLLLLAAGKLTGREVSVRRLFVSSAAGGLYAVASAFFPYTVAFALPVRIAFGVIMVAISYPGRTVQSFAAVTLSFYLCASIAAGTAMGLQNQQVASMLKGTASLSNTGSPGWRVVAVSLACLCALPVVAKLGGFQPGRPLPLLRMELQVDGRKLGLTGMVDTGNNLRDPISGLPVVVVDWERLRSVVPSDAAAFFQSTWDRMPEGFSGTPMGKRLRLIPYENLTGQKSVLPGFRPDVLIIFEKGGHRVKKNAIVGVFRERLSPSGLYQALLHPDLVSL